MSDESDKRADNAAAAGPHQSSADAVADRNYEIGYGKPPKATQYKKGQCGNLKGRKKKEEIDDVRIVIDRVLDEPAKLHVGGKVRTVSKLEAMVEALRVSALRGDAKAALKIFKQGQKMGMFSKAKPKRGIVIDQPGTDEEKMILRAFLAEQGGGNGAVNATDAPRMRRS